MYLTFSAFMRVKCIVTTNDFRQAAQARLEVIRKRMDTVRKFEFDTRAARRNVRLATALDDSYVAEYSNLLNAVAYLNFSEYGGKTYGYSITPEQARALAALQR